MSGTEEKVIIGDDSPENYKPAADQGKETPTDGGAKPDGDKGSQDGDDKVYAGRFKSPEDMEKSYTELEKKMSEQGNEVGELRKQNERFLSLLEQQKSGTDTPEEAQEKEDLAAKMEEIAQQVEDGDLSIADGIMQTSQITQQIATENTLKSMDERQQQQAAQASQARFAEENEDFFDLRDSGELDKVKSDLPGFHDDISAYYAHKAQAAQASLEAAVEAARAEGFEAGKVEMAKVADGDKNTRKVLQKPGESAKDIGAKPSGSYTQSEMRQSGLAALKAARGG